VRSIDCQLLTISLESDLEILKSLEVSEACDVSGTHDSDVASFAGDSGSRNSIFKALSIVHGY